MSTSQNRTKSDDPPRAATNHHFSYGELDLWLSALECAGRIKRPEMDMNVRNSLLRA